MCVCNFNANNNNRCSTLLFYRPIPLPGTVFDVVCRARTNSHNFFGTDVREHGQGARGRKRALLRRAWCYAKKF